jgi:Transglutaminase-like superfamily
LNATIAELARAQTAGAKEPTAKARRIYDYVAPTMRYDKSGEGWGRDDFRFQKIKTKAIFRVTTTVLGGILRRRDRMGAGRYFGGFEESSKA